MYYGSISYVYVLGRYLNVTVRKMQLDASIM